MRLKLIQSLLTLSMLAFVCSVALAQQRPLITEDVETVKQGSARIEFGFDFQQDRDFTLSGLNADLTRLGVVMMRIGLGPNIEFESGGVLQNFISINRQFRQSGVPLDLSQGTNSSHDWGDFYLATKFRLRPETRKVPGIGFRFAVELPNSNQSRGIGLNQMNFYSTMIAGKHFGKFNVFGNVGLGILTAPLDRFTQNDVLLYGIAGAYEMSERLTLVGELQGRYSSRKHTPIGTESDGAARFGARIRAAGLMWDVSGQAGLYKHSARTGLSFGVSYESPVLNPVK
jgi:hypothetical protein